MPNIYGQKSDNSRLNYFDTDLLRYYGEEKRGNVMISPASVKSTLAMILEGAVGSTAMEIRNVLRLSPNKEEYREQLNLYLSVLQVLLFHSCHSSNMFYLQFRRRKTE